MPSIEQRDTAVPKFFIAPVKNEALSLKEGRPIFEDKEMVSIRQPGDRNTTWDTEVNDEIRGRFPKHYEAFKKGQERAAIGTPLEMWPILTRSRAAELKAVDIMTVEEYAGVPDSLLPKLGIGARAERDQAKAFLAASKDSAVAAENVELKERLARLEALVAGGNLSGPATPTPTDKKIEDCTDAELKEFIKRESGEPVRGNPSRETLIVRAQTLAEKRLQEAA